MMTKLLQSFLGQVKGQIARGHQRSNLTHFNIINRPIFDKLAHNSGTRRAKVLRKSAFDSSFNALLQGVFRFDLKLTV